MVSFIAVIAYHLLPFTVVLSLLDEVLSGLKTFYFLETEVSEDLFEMIETSFIKLVFAAGDIDDSVSQIS